MLKKIGIWMGMVLILLFITACTQTEEGQQVELEEKPNLETTNGSPSEDYDNIDVKEDPVDSFMHIHGLSYEKKGPYNLYMSTHHGLIQINSSNQWNWIGEPENRHDLMGFTIQDEDTIISSGHPADGSKLKNPLGVVISKDRGETWEPIALHGQVDFHVFEVNAGNPSILYGINSHGPSAGLFQSVDGGFKWEKVKSKGLPKDLMTVYSIVSDPDNPLALLAGLQDKLLESKDGGLTWTLKSNTQTFTSAIGTTQPSGNIVAYLLGENGGLMSSDDFGETWTTLNLKLEADAAMHIGIHPTQEGVYTVGTHKEHVLQTTNGGETWTNLAESGKPVK